MSLHLPFSMVPGDEFRLPTGVWWSSWRAIVLDSWLMWRDALPASEEERGQLTPLVMRRIADLARRIHFAHQQMPDYRLLQESPFTVGRWWDPYDDDEWDTGGRCLFKVEGYSADEVIRYLSLRTQPNATRISSNWVEIQWPPTASNSVGQAPLETD